MAVKTKEISKEEAQAINEKIQKAKDNRLYGGLINSKERKPLQPLKTVSMNDLMKKDFPPINYYLNKLIPKNSNIIIGAKSGKFKTGLTLNLLLSMTRGHSFLGIFACMESPKILYYELDGNGEESMMRKIKYFMSGQVYNEDIRHRLDFAWDFDVNNLEGELEHIKPYDLIILDSYRRFLKGDENQSKVTNEFFANFLKKAKEMGKTCIVLHHLKKPIDSSEQDLIDSFRGSTDIVAQFDLGYGIVKTDDKEDIQNKTTTFDVFVKNGKDRNDAGRKQFTFNVLKDEQTNKTFLTFTGYDKPIEEFGKIEQAIILYLKNRLEAKREDIIKHLKTTSNCSASTIIRHLGELVNTGDIDKSSYGEYKLRTKN